MTGIVFATIVALLVYVGACVAIAVLGWWFSRKGR